MHVCAHVHVQQQHSSRIQIWNVTAALACSVLLYIGRFVALFVCSLQFRAVCVLSGSSKVGVVVRSRKILVLVSMCGTVPECEMFRSRDIVTYDYNFRLLFNRHQGLNFNYRPIFNFLTNIILLKQGV